MGKARFHSWNDSEEVFLLDRLDAIGPAKHECIAYKSTIADTSEDMFALSYSKKNSLTR